MRLVINGGNTLAEAHPELLAYWDYDRNDCDPRLIACDSKKSVHWVCDEGHDHRWMETVDSMVKRGWCPGCANGEGIVKPKRKPKPGKSFAELCPEATKEWHETYNGDVTPHDFSIGLSHVKYWWTCSKHGIVWCATPNDRSQDKGCPMCRSEKIGAARSRVIPGHSLADEYPDLTMEWDIQRNDTTPDKLPPHARADAHWVCLKCRRRWVAPIYNRTCNGAGCNVCSTEIAAAKERVPEEGHSLKDKYPNIASELVISEYGNTDPSEIAYSSGMKCTWKCSICGETVWDAVVNARTAYGDDTPGCTKCKLKNGLKDRMVPKNGEYLKDAAKSIAEEWDTERNRKELGLEIEDVALHSNLKVYWICPRCKQSYLMSVNKRTSRGDGCTLCDDSAKSSFPEKALLFYLQMAFEDAVGNASPDLVGLGRKDFDIWIPSVSTAIEYDGFAWHQDEDRDIMKEQICFFNNVSLIRVRESRCPVYQSLLSTTVVVRNSNGGFASMDAAIAEVFRRIGCDNVPDINTMRDEGAIRKKMHLEFIKNSLGEVRPDIASQWDYDGNGDLTPWMFKPYSSVVVSWLCPKGRGPYVQKISARTKRGDVCSCKECVSERMSIPKKPKPGKSLQDLFPDLAKEWREDLNGGIMPCDVRPTSYFDAYWTCPNHEEPYRMKVTYRAGKQRSGCPFCSTPTKQVLVGFNDLATKHPELVDEWDTERNGNRTPYNTLPGSHYVASWKCTNKDCGARWQESVGSRVRSKGCPACHDRRISYVKD